MRISLNKKAIALIIALAVVVGVGARVGWDYLASIGPDSQSKSSGTLNGKASVVYELRTNPGANPGGPVPHELRRRLELVKDAPLLARKSLYEVDEAGVVTLVREYTIIEYKLLPAGSTMPSKP